MENVASEINKSKYQIIPRTLVFIENGDDILMIHRNQKDTFGYGKYNGVGGHVEQGEDPTNSAIREINEETGLSITDLELVAIFFIDINANPGIGLFVYKGKTKAREFVSCDEGNLQWINKFELRTRKDVIQDVSYLLDIAKNHKNGSSPTIGKYTYNKKGQLRIAINP